MLNAFLQHMPMELIVKLSFVVRLNDLQPEGKA